MCCRLPHQFQLSAQWVCKENYGPDFGTGCGCKQWGSLYWMSTCSHQERCWIYPGTWQHIQIGCDNQKRLFPNWTEKWMMNTDSFSAGGYDNTFSVQWENTICLICKTKLAVLKEYNLKRHYTTEHGEQYEKYKGDEGKKNEDHIEDYCLNKVFSIKRRTLLLPLKRVVW